MNVVAVVSVVAEAAARVKNGAIVAVHALKEENKMRKKTAI